ncbi:Type-2 ice-structuring protein Type II antifreeze protein [Channa argus]|uniref:Type-2 ice-structuring protein Type II antifreeze protein n=1 Tax=Channa argus TaxID=215402 RepID=A0A6G1Q6I5_CHAAH|nr:Type-2 ice-structuring protein Type II antifreeze protein [Channa argus]KAK2899583.1 hypothetical protein Q8A73_012712 [Channa argus]
MKIVTVFVLGCAILALTRAAAPPEDEEAEDNQRGSSDLVKRYLLCCNGWTNIEGACFQYVSKKMTWAKAEKNCQTMGAHLASVKSEKEYHEIQKLTAPYGNKETWIGGSDAQEENEWLWADGEKFVYTNWCKDQPSNYQQLQHCLQMNFQEKKCWDDHKCDTLLPSICVKRGCGVGSP